MSAPTQTQQERNELETVLQSGIFNRAPNLARFLQYVCDRYFEGNGPQIKEYNIATEALGRRPEFDQKKDSIVRVEAHKLRKRLADYYRGPGADHSIQIVILPGQYAPQFLHTAASDEKHLVPVMPIDPIGPAAAAESQNPEIEILEPLSPQLLPLAETELVKAPRHSSTGRLTRKVPSRWWIATIFLLLLAAGLWLRSKIRNPATVPAAAAPVSSEFRMLAGYHGAPKTDRDGHPWVEDMYYQGGQARNIPVGSSIEGLSDPSLLTTYRRGDFHYDIPLRPGTYELHLLFAETEYGVAGYWPTENRLQRVDVNGETKLYDFDILSEAGATCRLHERVFKDISPTADGRLHLRFRGVVSEAILNGLEILPSVPGTIQPIRIVARNTAVTDTDGQLWSADKYFIGGYTVVRADSVTSSRERPLYEGERYGNFSYHIPVAPGKYRVSLRFAETWFGRPQAIRPSGDTSAVGARIFNVFANGTALLRNFDITETAGGTGLGIEKVFQPIEPNAQGLIVLEFVPVRNYACINAIEVSPAEPAQPPKNR